MNSTFQLNYAKIEDCGTGALYCQIFDKIYYPTPSIPMSKVNFGAKHEYESVENFKLLQQAIDKVAAQHNVTPKAVPVAQLVRCKYQVRLFSHYSIPRLTIIFAKHIFLRIVAKLYYITFLILILYYLSY